MLVKGATGGWLTSSFHQAPETEHVKRYPADIVEYFHFLAWLTMARSTHRLWASMCSTNRRGMALAHWMLHKGLWHQYGYPLGRDFTSVWFNEEVWFCKTALHRFFLQISICYRNHLLGLSTVANRDLVVLIHELKKITPVSVGYTDSSIP